MSPAQPQPGVVMGAGPRPSFRKWFSKTLKGQEHVWMEESARYYSHVSRDLKSTYSEKDKRLEWLKDLTLERLRLSSEDFRSYVIAIGAALVSFIAAQLGADVKGPTFEASLIAILIALLAFLYLSMRLEYTTTLLSARINGICDILRVTDSSKADNVVPKDVLVAEQGTIVGKTTGEQQR